MLKTAITLGAVLSLAVPAMATSIHSFGTQQGATEMAKKKVVKKTEKKTEEGADGGTTKEEHTDKTEKTEP